MVREPVNHGDRTRRIRKDRVPLFEREIGRNEEGAMFIAPTDDLKEEVCGVGVVGEVSDLVDGEEVWSRIVPETALEGAGGLLAVEIEHQVRGGDEEAGVAGQDGVMDEVLGAHGLAEALGADEDDVVSVRQEVEREDALEGRAIEGGRPVPVPVGDRFETPEAGALQAPFDAPAPAVLELGGDDVLEEHGGTPAEPGGAGEDVVEILGRPQQPKAPAVIRQGRRDVG